MRWRARILGPQSLLAVLALSACGGKVVVDADSSTSSSAESASVSGSSTSTGNASGSTGTGAGGGGYGTLSEKLSDATLVADCQPEVPADPWHLTFSVDYINASGAPALAVITSTLVTFANGQSLSFEMSPASSGDVNAGNEVAEMYQSTSSTPDIPGDCMLCGVHADVAVTFEDGNQPSVLHLDAAAMCAL